MRTKGVSALMVVLGLVSVRLHAAPRPRLTLWNVSFDGHPLVCRKIVVGSHTEIPALMEMRRGGTCSMSDEGDHLALKCGQTVEVIVFDALGCKSWIKKKLTNAEQAEHVAFSGCFAKAKDVGGIDRAVPYCQCLAPKIASVGEERMAGKTESETKELLAPFIQQCAAAQQE